MPPRHQGLHLAVLILAWTAFVMAVYCPDIGRGFVKDDFTWIREARTDLASPSQLVLPRQVGFYRPLVAATFVADYRLHGWSPRGYGWTNVALYVMCAAAIAILGMTLGLSRWASIVAAFVWAINPHGINMAVVWLSGRTALLLTLFAVSAAAVFLRGRYLLASILIALALASKEEAVLLPFVLLAWHRQTGRSWTRAVLSATLIPLAAYLLVRSVTPAFTLATAPTFYQLTLAPSHILQNITAYVDRSVTIVAIAMCIAVAVYRVVPSLDDSRRRLLAMCAVWWAGMFAITILLPVRSSVYAVCPSVASAIAGAMLMECMRKESCQPRLWRVEFALALAVALAVPIYQLRNHAWVEGARISERTLSVIRADAPGLSPNGTIRLSDEPGTSSNFHNAFGDLASEAIQTAVGRDWTVEITTGREACETASKLAAEYQLIRGRVVRVAPCTAGTSN